MSLSGDAWLTLTASRLPRLAALVLTGVGLAVCGVILQHIVRNKFVEPGTTGGLDAARLGILMSLVLAPGAGAPARMLFALLLSFTSTVPICRPRGLKRTSPPSACASSWCP